MHDHLENGDLFITIVEKVDSDLAILEMDQPMLVARWIALGVKVDYKPAVEKAKEFASKHGRIDYLVPIFKALSANGYKPIGYQLTQANKDFYHPITREVLNQVLVEF